MKEYKNLISEYQSIQDDLLNYTEVFHDGMLFDIEGYIDRLYDEDYSDIDKLRNQVKSFRLILEGLKNIEYVFC